MRKRIIILVVIFLAVEGMIVIGASYIRSSFRFSSVSKSQEIINIATSSLNTFLRQKRESEIIQVPSTGTPPAPKIQPVLKPKTLKTTQSLVPEPVKEISSKSFEELVNGAVIQLYCGYLSGDGTNYSDISRGSGVIISKKGEILTNRHIIYDENMKKARPNCFVLKSPFPNSKSEKPKIYYSADIISYPLTEKISEIFSKDKYYNDFAILKITSRPKSDSKINQLLQTDYASEADYSVLENNGLPGGEASIFNYFPIDWNYSPKNDDFLITLGYGVDASHIANQITSTIGRVAGNIDIKKDSKPQILLIESNATSGFSGGALINPKSKGLIGLISWITAGDVTGKYTVALFRDFLAEMMLGELDFNLKAL